MVGKSSKLAQMAETSSQESKSKAESGDKIITEMIESMNTIKSKTEKLTDQMNQGNLRLGQIIEVINEVVDKTKVINEIVFQTKLLSFNASVEAARAGEQGKGFSVVAEEIDNLAQVSGNAANEINTLLDQSLSTVNSIITESKTNIDVSIETTKKAVDEGNRVAKNCQAVFSQIKNDSIKLSEMISSISLAAQESSKGTVEISSALKSISNSNKSNAQVALMTAKTASILEQQVSKLTDSANLLSRLVSGHGNLNTFVWKKQYALEIEAMDNEHKELISKINNLIQKQKQNKDISDNFEDLLSYTKYHFKNEEEYMNSIAYPDLNNHKKIHVNLLQNLSSHYEKLQTGKTRPELLINFLNDWLLKHILTIDMKYAFFSKAANKRPCSDTLKNKKSKEMAA